MELRTPSFGLMAAPSLRFIIWLPNASKLSILFLGEGLVLLAFCHTLMELPEPGKRSSGIEKGTLKVLSISSLCDSLAFLLGFVSHLEGHIWWKGVVKCFNNKFCFPSVTHKCV